MKKEFWVCLVHSATTPSVVSSDGYSSLKRAQDALVLRIQGTGYWENEFIYVDESKRHKYELKCITIED